MLSLARAFAQVCRVLRSVCLEPSQSQSLDRRYPARIQGLCLPRCAGESRVRRSTNVHNSSAVKAVFFATAFAGLALQEACLPAPACLFQLESAFRAGWSSALNDLLRVVSLPAIKSKSANLACAVRRYLSDTSHRAVPTLDGLVSSVGFRRGLERCRSARVLQQV